MIRSTLAATVLAVSLAAGALSGTAHASHSHAPTGLDLRCFTSPIIARGIETSVSRALATVPQLRLRFKVRVAEMGLDGLPMLSAMTAQTAMGAGYSVQEIIDCFYGTEEEVAAMQRFLKVYEQYLNHGMPQTRDDEMGA